MQSPVVAQFESLASQFLRGAQDAEDSLEALVVDPNPIPLIQGVYFQCNEEMTLFILAELIAKNSFGKRQVGVVYKFSYDASEFPRESKELQLQQEIINLTMQVLSERGPRLGDHVVRSLCNTVSVGIKHLWFSIEDKKAIANDILARFFSDPNNLGVFRVGVMLFSLLVQNMTLNNQSLGYFKFRNMINKFCEEILKAMAGVIKQMLVGLCRSLNPSNIELLKLTCHAMFLIVTYPFSLSYSDYSAEVNLEEVTTLFLPDVWDTLLLDRELLESLLALLTMKQVDLELKLKIVKIFSRLAAVRVSSGPDENFSAQHLRFMMNLPATMLANFTTPDRALLEDILDFYLRLLFVHGLKRITDASEIFGNWLETLQQVLKVVFKTYYQLDDRLFSTVNQIYKKFTYHYSSTDEFNFKNQLIQAFTLYMQNSFSTPGQLNIFKELTISRYEKFPKLVADRFEYFRDFYSFSKNAVLQTLDQAADLVMNELNALSQILEQEKQSGQMNKGPRNDIVLSRFSHLLLIVSQTVIVDEPRSIYRSTYMYNSIESSPGDESADMQPSVQREATLVAKCFVCISQINFFVSSISVGESSNQERNASLAGVLDTPILGPVLRICV